MISLLFHVGATRKNNRSAGWWCLGAMRDDDILGPLAHSLVGCPLCLSEGDWTWQWQQHGVCCFVGRWHWSMVSDGSFWVIMKMKTLKEVLQIFPEVSTSRSLNSCVDCKISNSVTSNALEFLESFESAPKTWLPTSYVTCNLNLACDLNIWNRSLQFLDNSASFVL